MQVATANYLKQDMPVAVRVDQEMLHVTLGDARIISTPLAWYPTLVRATSAQLANVRLSASGIHFPDLDEDLSIDGMLSGNHSR